MKCHDVAEYSM